MREKFNLIDKIVRNLRLKRILKFIPNNAVICDLGCGDGELLKVLSRKSKIIQGVGVDRHIVSGKNGKLEFINSDISEVSLPENFFNAVLMLAVIEHMDIDKVSQVLAEAKRILKSGGKLIITTPTPQSKSILEFLAFKMKIISRDEIAEHKHYYAKNELLEILAKLGFKKVQAEYFQFHLNSFYVMEK